MINHWFLRVYTAGVRFAVPGAVEVLFIGLPAFSEKKMVRLGVIWPFESCFKINIHSLF